MSAPPSTSQVIHSLLIAAEYIMRSNGCAPEQVAALFREAANKVEQSPDERILQ